MNRFFAPMLLAAVTVSPAAQAQNDPPLRPQQLYIEVDVGGSLKALDGHYKLVRAEPAVRTIAPIVFSNGDIDLRNAPGAPGFSQVTELFFTVVGRPTVDGKAYNVTFQSPPDAAITITDAGGSETRGVFTPSFPHKGSTSTLLVTDQNDTPALYHYHLNVVTTQSVRSHGGPATGTIDPAIVNRGHTGP